MRPSLSCGLRCLAAFTLFVCLSAQARTVGPRILHFRDAVYSIERSATDRSKLDEAIEWRYPVFLGPDARVARAINGRIREYSMRSLSTCSELSSEQLLALTDRQVVERIRADPSLSECGVLRSAAFAEGTFGTFATVVLRESIVNHSVSSAVTFLTFDLRTGREIDIQMLFKPDALGTLQEALDEQRSGSYPDCRSRPAPWSQVTLSWPSRVVVEYPFNGREWAECGDGLELLEGDVVSDLLLAPDALRPLWKLERVQ